jgi:Domain of unknown function (DUF222)
MTTIESLYVDLARRSGKMSEGAIRIEHMIETIAEVVGTEPPEPAGPLPASADLTTERLEAEICTLAGHLAAATCRFLDLIVDFDERRGWAAWDMPSCAAWLSWKCSLSPKTARDQLRTARALKDLPVLHGEFAAGRFSYSKARAVARVATPETEKDLVEMCALMTAAQVDRFCAAVGSPLTRDGQNEDEYGLPTGPRTELRWQFDEDNGELSMGVHLPPADGAVVLQALRAALGDLDHPHDGKPEPDLAGDQRPEEFKVPVGELAEALVEMAGAYLRGKVVSADNADVYQVQIHVVPEILDQDPVPAGTFGTDQEAAGPAGTPGMDHPCRAGRCHLEDGPAIPPAEAQRIACGATLSAMLHDPTDGSVLDAGRRSRSATAAIRRAVRERDGARCCFPGCDSRRTDLHHIVWWRNGGTTSLDNLLPVCKRHHTLIQAKGYIITRLGPGQYSFTDPSAGTVIEPQGVLPVDDGPFRTAGITDTTIQQALGDRLDLHFAVWVALNNGRDRGNDRYLHYRPEAGLAA